MNVAGKIWGKTSQIEANSSFELHRIEVIGGHRCSKHRHLHKFNGFFVEAGTLEVTVWKEDSGTVDKTVLTGGDYMAVAPGEYHQFKALEDTTAFEVYWVELSHNDIDRETFGQ